MAKAQKVVLSPEEKAEAKQKRWAQIKRDKWMYLLLLPGFLYFIIFKIVPMWGILISFKDYYAGIPFFGSNFFNGWIGFDNFKNFFTDSSFLQLLRNTLIISGMNIIFFFPLPIVLALLLNEIKVQWYKKVLQTLVYVPHFVSMVVIASITFMLVKTPSMEGMSGGALYEIVKSMTGKNLNALGSPIAIYWVLLIQNIWKETGWGANMSVSASYFNAAQKKIQLRNTFDVTCTTSYRFDVFTPLGRDPIGFTIPMKVRMTGMSEKFWK